MQRETAMEQALRRARRRAALWHAARMACFDDETFFANLAEIERAVAYLLDAEEKASAPRAA